MEHRVIMDVRELIEATPRLLIEVDLRPVQGQRFQPTWFPDLGAALYETPTGSCLLVESAQSMANHLEMVCWDRATNDLAEPLRGLSYVRVERDGQYLTSSIEEPHRLNSPYILESKDKTFAKTLGGELRPFDSGPVDLHRVAALVLRYDACSLLHGLFLARKELAHGRIRVQRALSGFIEAQGVRMAPSGGVKHDPIDPQGDRNKGFGHVPFQRDEYTAESLTAFFNVDLSQIHGYGLGAAACDLLVGLARFKIQRFLHSGLRLRTACDLEPIHAPRVTRPRGFPLPERAALEGAMPGLIGACADRFAGERGVTCVVFKA
jgi:CRISPR-associated protein Csb1